MSNFPESFQKVIKRVELVIGKAQIGDVNYYLVKLNNEPLQNCQWMTTLEVAQKRLFLMKEFNRKRIRTLKLNWYFIDKKALEQSLLYHKYSKKESKNADRLIKILPDKSVTSKIQIQSKIEAQFQLLKSLFIQKLAKKIEVWNLSSFITLKIQAIGSKIYSEGKNIYTKKQPSTLKLQQNDSGHFFCRPQIKIDYDSLNCNNNSRNQNKKLGTFIGRMIFDNHRLYLVKGTQDILANSRWIYFQGTMRMFKIIQKLKRINIKSKDQQKLVIDEAFILQHLKSQNRSFDNNMYASFSTIDIKQENCKFLLNYEYQIASKKNQQEETRLVPDFLFKKLKQLDDLIQSDLFNLSILQIIGKTKVNRQLFYLIKAIDKSNQIHFHWRRLKKDSHRPKQYKQIKRFNQIYNNQPLPYIITEYRSLKSYFLDLLCSIPFQRIEKIIAKKVCPEGIFYLAKFQNSITTESKWINWNSNLPNYQFYCKKTREFNLRFSSQKIQCYLDQETILIELYQEKIKQLQQKYVIVQEQIINEKKIYEQAQKIFDIFQSEKQIVQKLVYDKIRDEKNAAKHKKIERKLIRKEAAKSELIKHQHFFELNFEEQSSDDYDCTTLEEETKNEKKIKQQYKDSKKKKKALKKTVKIQNQEENSSINKQRKINKKKIQYLRNSNYNPKQRFIQSKQVRKTEIQSDFDYKWLEDVKQISD